MRLEELVVEIVAKVDSLEKGLDKARKELAGFRREQEETTKKNKDLEGSFLALSASAVASFVALTGAVKSGIAAYNEYTSAMVGLKSIADGTGASFKEAQEFIKDFTADGLVPAANAATALKNLLSRGYTDTQAIEVLERLKDAASFGRQASLDLGQAVASATEGLKNENSILVNENCPARGRSLAA